MFTAAHVVALSRPEEIEFVFSPATGQQETIRGGRVLHLDFNNDIAILLMNRDATESRGLLRLSRQKPRRLEKVIAIGNPGLGASGAFSPNAAISGEVGNLIANWIHLNMNLNPGNSGGPVLSAESGEVVGIVSHRPKESESEAPIQGISLALASDFAATALDRILQMDAQQLEAQAQQNERTLRANVRFLRVLRAVAAIWQASEVYRDYCIEVVVKDGRELMRKHGTQKGMAALNSKLDEYRRNAQKSYTPAIEPLRKEYETLLSQIRSDTEIDSQIRTEFDTLYNEFLQLQHEAEQLPRDEDPNRRYHASLDAFEARVTEKYERFSNRAKSLIEKMESQLK